LTAPTNLAEMSQQEQTADIDIDEKAYLTRTS